jgi:hypothetical protein
MKCTNSRRLPWWTVTRKLQLLGVVLLVSSLAFGQSGPVPPTYFSMNANLTGVLESWHSPYPTVPFGSMRLWDAVEAQWADTETSRGVYNWAGFDNWISVLNTHGVTDIEYTFGRTPGWAGPGETLSPTNIQDFDDFVSAVGNRYKGKIKTYEIWNEVNASNFWQGTPAQLVTLQQHAYKILKAIDPNVVILSPSIQGNDPDSLSRFLAAGGAAYVDAVAVHLYHATSSQLEVEVGSWIDRYRSVMTQNGIGTKPLWNTEFGWGLNSQSPDVNAQAALVARAYLYFWSRGLPRTYWYAYDNNTWGTLLAPSSGNPGTLTLAGVAYQQVYSWMVGNTMTAICSAAGTIWTCGFTNADQSTSLAVWNTAATSTYVPSSQYTQMRDLAGNTTSVTGSISIGPKPVLLFSTLGQGVVVNPPTDLKATVQ